MNRRGPLRGLRSTIRWGRLRCFRRVARYRRLRGFRSGNNCGPLRGFRRVVRRGSRPLPGCKSGALSGGVSGCGAFLPQKAPGDAGLLKAKFPHVYGYGHIKGQSGALGKGVFPRRGRRRLLGGRQYGQPVQHRLRNAGQFHGDGSAQQIRNMQIHADFRYFQK